MIVLVFTEEVLLLLQNEVWISVYVGTATVFLWWLADYMEYRRQNTFLRNMVKRAEELDKVYLLPEVAEEPEAVDQQMVYEILQMMERSMTEHVNEYKFANEEYKEYIELWIHEVKVPIAAGKMIAENHRDAVTESMEEELDKIEGYTEQALYYARSYSLEKDYIIQRLSLKELVNQVIIKNKKAMIAGRIRVELWDLEETVYSDSKWIVFILNQIIGNSIKYRSKKQPQIRIWGEQKKEQIVLHIWDNGIGIPDSDLPRIFEKGFTGQNGRNYRRSTGIGLYLCRKLCKRLGIGIRAASKSGDWTEITILFPKSSMHNIIG